jgi:hypothetical protein
VPQLYIVATSEHQPELHNISTVLYLQITSTNLHSHDGDSVHTCKPPDRARMYLTTVDNWIFPSQSQNTILQPTNSKEQSPFRELTVTQLFKKFPTFLCNQKSHYRVHNGLPLVPILSQIIPVQTFLPPYFPKIRYNVTLPSTPRSSKWFLPFRFSDKIL